jgi:hypothetical protein
MDVLVFLGSLVLLAVIAIWLAKAISRSGSGRKRSHPTYHESVNKSSKRRRPAHSLVHSHSADRLHAKEDIWRASRIRANEARWQPGVIVANKILSDSELKLEERESLPGNAGRGIDYSPSEASSPSKTARGARSNKRP